MANKMACDGGYLRTLPATNDRLRIECGMLELGEIVFLITQI